MPEKNMSSGFRSASPETLQEAIAELGLSRRGDQLFEGEQHVANVHAESLIFFLMQGGNYSELVAKAAESRYLSAF